MPATAESLARFALGLRREDVPAPVLALARRHVLDTPERPLADAEVDAKFLANATRTLPGPRARRVAGMAWRLDTLPGPDALLAGRVVPG